MQLQVRTQQLYIVLTHHPSVRALRLDKRLATIFESFRQDICMYIGYKVSFRVAWRNGSSPYALQLRNQTLRTWNISGAEYER